MEREDFFNLVRRAIALRGELNCEESRSVTLGGVEFWVDQRTDLVCYLQSPSQWSMPEVQIDLVDALEPISRSERLTRAAGWRVTHVSGHWIAHQQGFAPAANAVAYQSREHGCKAICTEHNLIEVAPAAPGFYQSIAEKAGVSLYTWEAVESRDEKDSYGWSINGQRPSPKLFDLECLAWKDACLSCGLLESCVERASGYGVEVFHNGFAYNWSTEGASSSRGFNTKVEAAADACDHIFIHGFEQQESEAPSA